LRLKYPTSFLAPLLGNGSCASFKPEFILFFFFLPPFYHHHHTTWISRLFINSLLQMERPPSSHPILTDGYELRPAFKVMVQEKSFSRLADEDPYTHLREFEQLCSCRPIAGVDDGCLP
jgi:hypothetical protein